MAPIAAFPSVAAAAVNPVTNPTMQEECGIPLTLVLDASGSIDSSHAVNTVRDAASTFLGALKNTGSTARVLDFGTVARQTAAPVLVTDQSLATGGAHANALKAYYNPIPPITSPTSARRYDGSGNPLNAANYGSVSNSSNQYTNWDQSLDLAGATPAGATRSDLVVYITDGDPTAFDFNQSGDPFFPNGVAFSTDGSSEGRQVTLDRAVEEANQIKSAGTRMLAVGVGSAVTDDESVQRLVKIAGPKVVTNAAQITSLNAVDVAVVKDFASLAAALRKIVTELCSPSLTIRKLAQTPDSPEYQPASGWNVTVNPTILGSGTYKWIQPKDAPLGPQTVTTNANGFSNFQWEPNPPNLSSSAEVVETTKPGFTPAPTACSILKPDGTTVIVPVPPDPTHFTLQMGPEDIATCTLKNSFNYAPAINVTKVNTPTGVRGDLDPPATVTSNYVVTNPGNTPLHAVTLVDGPLIPEAPADGTCAPVTPVPPLPNAGDTDRDGLLDPGEAWQFTCTQDVQESLSTAPINVDNTVTATGTDPTGTHVSDTATDDYDVFTPGIHVEKTVRSATQDPGNLITVTAGTPVTYTYAVTNTGNVALANVTLADDTPPCDTSPPLTPLPTAINPGDTNANRLLDLTETWTYTCTATPTATGTTVNLATVTGTPSDPGLPDPGPPVSDSDRAAVNVIDPQLSLTKAVNEELVLPGTQVTYTYVATNTGENDLRNPADPSGEPTIPPVSWVTDNTCFDPGPVYVSGDVNNDGILNAGVNGDEGESWTFTCSTTIEEETLNTATITAVTLGPNPTTLTRTAEALVEVGVPAISITKEALRDVVLDPGAEPVSGPDVPDPRQAIYAYTVSNDGPLPLVDVFERLEDDTCSPLLPLLRTAPGGPLMPGQVWRFVCFTPLSQADGVPPDFVVTNTVTVEGTPVLGETPHPEADVSDSATAEVQVIKPSLTLTKTASDDLVRPGQLVTYTGTVMNTGDAGLEIVDGGDDKCSPVEFTGGDTNNNGILDGTDSGHAETWTYTCAQPIDAPVTNVATVIGIDPLGNAYEETATKTVRIFVPGIHLEKAVSDELVLVGTPVTYTFTVTNTGESPLPADDVLSKVTLSDVAQPATPTCAKPTFTGGDTGNVGFLDKTETWTYTCTATINATTNNVATVQGTDIESGLVDSQDYATVNTFKPGIAVVKSASPTTVESGGEVTYTYRVTNTGNVPLGGVKDSITDDACSPLTYVSGDTDRDNQLDTDKSIFESGPGETWIFTCSATLTESTVNTVVVNGTPVAPDGTALCQPASPLEKRVSRLQNEASCAASGTDTASVTVTEAAVLPTQQPGTIPKTGGDGLGAARLGVVLLVCGLIALGLSHPRRRGRHE
jgi:uncharacterized repeat protein (TIGR01451 family)